MKLIIAGGRDYQLTEQDYLCLDGIHANCRVSEVVCGGATGADECGKKWATEREIPVIVFPADWKTHGKSAGPKRNREMANYGDAVALFPGGRGTDSMYAEADRADIVIFDFREAVA